MAEMEIQKCSTPQQIESIAALAQEIWHEHYDALLGADQVDYMLKRYQSAPALGKAIHEQGYEYDIAYEDGRAVGYCGICPEEKELFLSKLYVHKDYRHRGIARKLLERAIHRAKDLEYSTIYLTVNKENRGSIAAYETMGFEKREDVVTDIGDGYVMDDYVMEKAVE